MNKNLSIEFKLKLKGKHIDNKHPYSFNQMELVK